MSFLKISYLVIALLVLAAESMATNYEGISLNEAVQSGNISMVKNLIAEGSDVNAATWDYIKTSPLMEAAAKGDKEICKILIAAGAEVNQQNEYGKTALYAAVSQNKSQDIIEMLIEEGADVNVRNQENLFKESRYVIWSPLMKAVDRQNTKICKLLISKGADVNYEDHYGNTALLIATEWGNNNLDILKMLIEEGAEIDASYTYDRSDPNHKYTPLMIAANYGMLEKCNILIAAGADVNYQNPEGDTPLFVAMIKRTNPEIVRILIKAGADIMLEKPITKYHHYDEGGTAFMKGIFWCAENLEIFEPFISAGIDLNHQYSNGMTALSLAIRQNNYQGSHSDMIKFLVDAGADVNAWPRPPPPPKNAYHPGWTPLMYMAQSRDEEMCNFLISRGAKVGEGSGLVMRLLQEEEEKINEFLVTLQEEGNDGD